MKAVEPATRREQHLLLDSPIPPPRFMEALSAVRDSGRTKMLDHPVVFLLHLDWISVSFPEFMNLVSEMEYHQVIVVSLCLQSSKLETAAAGRAQ